ncbi:hypothetical protein EJ02DRAFT_260814 [Clathrospora elynae]|uniref:Uncharacterized protein n=1 Tax=Clathrospora elynae TaxID=706981 RepID=A0A6A5T2Z3_9PLEO|nr:hypothetical protein EJ02DRAFT_260814 [Clathrospora elynae]
MSADRASKRARRSLGLRGGKACFVQAMERFSGFKIRLSLFGLQAGNTQFGWQLLTAAIGIHRVHVPYVLALRLIWLCIVFTFMTMTRSRGCI